MFLNSFVVLPRRGTLRVCLCASVVCARVGIQPWIPEPITIHHPDIGSPLTTLCMVPAASLSYLRRVATVVTHE